MNNKYKKLICEVIGHKFKICDYENRIKTTKAYKEKHNKAVMCDRCFYTLTSYKELNNKK